jgi:hypothetical protein
MGSKVGNPAKGPEKAVEKGKASEKTKKDEGKESAEKETKGKGKEVKKGAITRAKSKGALKKSVSPTDRQIGDLTSSQSEPTKLRDPACDQCIAYGIDCIDGGHKSCQNCNKNRRACLFNKKPRKPAVPRGANRQKMESSGRTLEELSKATGSLFGGLLVKGIDEVYGNQTAMDRATVIKDALFSARVHKEIYLETQRKFEEHARKELEAVDRLREYRRPVRGSSRKEEPYPESEDPEDSESHDSDYSDIPTTADVPITKGIELGKGEFVEGSSKRSREVRSPVSPENRLRKKSKTVVISEDEEEEEEDEKTDEEYVPETTK